MKEFYLLTSPYSKLKVRLKTFPGSFPFFLIGKNGFPNSMHIIGPKRKPRESKPTMKSTSRNKICSTIKSFIALTAAILRKIPNISLKIKF